MNECGYPIMYQSMYYVFLGKNNYDPTACSKDNKSFL